LSKASVETWTRPNVSARILAWVYLPDPGHPTIITLGGLFGALFLNLKSIIFINSLKTSGYGFSWQSYSKIN